MFLRKVLFQTEGYLHVGSLFSISRESRGAHRGAVFFFKQNQFLLTFLFKVDVAGGIFEQASLKRDTFMSACVMGRLVVIVDLLFF